MQYEPGGKWKYTQSGINATARGIETYFLNFASNMTAATLFRIIEQHQPTVLLDEADAYLRNNEEARSIVNAGHKKDGAVFRCVGDDHEPRAFNVFSPMVIAGIGNQRDTIEDRIEFVWARPRVRSRTRSNPPGAEVPAGGKSR